MNASDPALLAARPDFAAIARWVTPGARVLDLGCGDGALLRYLWEARQAPGYGVEIDDAEVVACVRNDVNVLQMNLEDGLSVFRDGSFDYVLLSETLQTIHRTEQLMREMLRVGREVIVSFPNFGHWHVRWAHLVSGRSPQTELFPYEWYDSPNIHFLTVIDFETLARKQGWRIERSIFLAGGREVSAFPNLMAEVAVFLFTAA